MSDRFDCCYFGCWDEIGHFLHDRHGSSLYEHPIGDWYQLDGGYCPAPENKLGVWKRSVVNGFTVLSCWDRSVDMRPASNAAFVVRGDRTIDEVLEAAQAAFPDILERILSQFPGAGR